MIQTTLSKVVHTTCVVVGGGPAGYGAAMAVARAGQQVLLVERHGFLGGMSTAAGLNSYINYQHGGLDLSEAVYRDLRDTLIHSGHGYIGEGGHVDFFDIEACKRTMEQNLLNAGGRLLYHSLLRSVRRERDEWTLEFLAKGAAVLVRARFVIDATGDADACTLAGVTMTHGRRSDGKTQPMSMIVQLGGFDPAAWERAGNKLINGRFATGGDCFPDEVRRAREAGEWAIPRERISMWWSMPADPTHIGINATRILGRDACDPFDVTAAEIEGRRQAAALARFFRDYIPGFSNSYLLQTGPQIGVRESRRIVGRSTMRESDIVACREPADTVVRCAYPIDVHSPDNADMQFDMASKEFLYGIPYGCLLPASPLENIAAAGRCISATHEAAGSFRVMPTCMALGEAAGTAVALAASTGKSLSEIPAQTVREHLQAARLGLTRDDRFSHGQPMTEMNIPVMN
ncbi:FAD-dependent oxidoreductase [Opitutaceae bacterium TAV4]|nr:FAD-dependent oxidoreductase [Opitutaceae bacterium TAV4]RRJ98921.1 FAD-dependent oxidoreductase [Opitutaceae bacterium TAV3]